MNRFFSINLKTDSIIELALCKDSELAWLFKISKCTIIKLIKVLI